MDFKSEVIPVDAKTWGLMKADFTFWSVCFLAIMPLFLTTLPPSIQLQAFCIYFATIWAMVFKKFILKDEGSWKLPIMSAAFTALIGLPFLLFIYGYLPSFYLQLADGNFLMSLLGSMIQVGPLEELCKLVPIGAYLVWKRKEADPLTIVLLGVFSGLGFAAVENIKYAFSAIFGAVESGYRDGAEGVANGTGRAMINMSLRSMSLVFAHAIFTGTSSYFIALGVATQQRRIALFVVGVLAASFIHGFYNWCRWANELFPAVTVAFAFVVFYSYLTKLRGVLAAQAEQGEQQPVEEEVTTTVAIPAV